MEGVSARSQSRDCAERLSCASAPRAGNNLDHFRRAASSVVLNLAEGSMHTTKRRKLYYYSIALASLGECNAVLRVMQTYHPDTAAIIWMRDICSHALVLLKALIASIDRRPR
jgi:four helix bundle protein